MPFSFFACSFSFLLQSLLFDDDQLLTFFISLESVSHQGVHGYDTYCHVRNPNEVFKSIDKQHKAISEKKVRVKLHRKEDACSLSELKESRCKDYFKRYFEKLAKIEPVVLPQVQRGIEKVVDTMERWCNDTNSSSDLKGLVVHSFNVSEYLKKLFYNELEKAELCKDLDIKDFPSAPIFIVYNPKESLILLIRKSGKEELTKEIRLCSDNMKMFMVLFGSECKLSKVKVISLLASSKTTYEDLKCEECKNFIVPFEALELYESFRAWMDSHAEKFDIINTEKIIEAKIIATSEKLIGCLAAAPYFDDIPTFTGIASEQMRHVLTFLTPDQKDILSSDQKHLIIRGPYGSGKSIVACKKMQMFIEELRESKKNELVYFVCHDCKSGLLSEIGRVPNVKIHATGRDKKLSEIVRDILKETNSENVNLFVDEYDGETLGQEEAETLNGIFEEHFQDTIVFLVPQSMVKERNVCSKEKSAKEEKNMFHLLKTMKKVDLDLAMRNPIQINNLIVATQNFLKTQETVYQHPRRKIASKDSTKKNENSTERLSVSAINLNPKQATSKGDKQLKNQEQQLIKESESTGKSSSNTKNQEKYKVRNFGPDEAFNVARIPRASKDDENRIINQFKYVESRDIGHNISSDYPELFEMVFENNEKGSFEKLCALNCTFQKLNIHNSNSNNKHVILHFDTSADKTPKLLTLAFQHLKIKDKVTNNYQDFKASKSVLVCNFRLFRGLEHSNVTVFIDQDMYSMQHYLVEVMARCTNKLSIVAVQRSDALSRIIMHWENGLSGQLLIDQWKIQRSIGGIKRGDYQEDKDLKLITIDCSSKNHEEMRKMFDQHEKKNDAFNITHIRAEELEAEEFIQKR